MPTIGTSSIRYKRTYFSIVICPDPEMDLKMTNDIVQGLTAFDLSMLLPRKGDSGFVPFTVCGAYAAELSPERWVFEITDYETIERLREL